jgi:hypothetical protein
VSERAVQVTIDTAAAGGLIVWVIVVAIGAGVRVETLATHEGTVSIGINARVAGVLDVSIEVIAVRSNARDVAVTPGVRAITVTIAT